MTDDSCRAPGGRISGAWGLQAMIESVVFPCCWLGRVVLDAKCGR